ncbi:MAG: O-antigen ligase family protein, partial [Acidobacteria bacterium]|nr:O-antigen ligase family protein [Acidobacteriota bacterium]
LPVALGARNRQLLNRGLGGAGVAFLISLLVSTLAADHLEAAFQLYVKWATVGVTFFVVERLILTVRDFVLASYGLILGVALIALRGLYIYRLEPTYYVEVLPGVGSRNVFSLWTLAPLALALLLFSSHRTSRRAKLLMLVAVISLIVPQVLSLSRSGWMLVAATFLMVFATRLNLRVIVGLLIAMVALQLAIERLGFEEKIGSRIEDLRYGTSSDSLRGNLISDGLQVFFDHPLVGVSQADLPFELGQDLFRNATSTHNLIIDLLGGTGMLGTVPFLLCILILYRRWRGSRRAGWFAARPELTRALPIIVAAIALRSLTSDEILFCPAIVFGLASTYGLLTSRPPLQAAQETPRLRMPPERVALPRAAGGSAG